MISRWIAPYIPEPNLAGDLLRPDVLARLCDDHAVAYPSANMKFSQQHPAFDLHINHGYVRTSSDDHAQLMLSMAIEYHDRAVYLRLKNESNDELHKRRPWADAKMTRHPVEPTSEASVVA